MLHRLSYQIGHGPHGNRVHALRIRLIPPKTGDNDSRTGPFTQLTTGLEQWLDYADEDVHSTALALLQGPFFRAADGTGLQRCCILIYRSPFMLPWLKKALPNPGADHHPDKVENGFKIQAVNQAL